MKTTKWRIASGAGIIAAGIAALVGSTALQFVAAIVFTLSGLGFFLGTRKHHAQYRPMAYSLGILGLTLGAQHALDATYLPSHVSTHTQLWLDSGAKTIADACLAFALWNLGNLRQADSNRTAGMDAFIITGNIAVVTMALFGVAVLQRASISDAAKASFVIDEFMNMTTLFAYSRAALAPGKKSVSYWVVSILPLCVLLSDWLTESSLSGNSIFGGPTVALLVLTAGTAIASAAPHESTEISSTEIKSVRITAKYLVTMVSAIFAPPVTLVVTNPRFARLVVLAWMIVLVAVVVRIGKVIRIQAQADRIASILGETFFRLRTSKSRNDVLNTAMGAVSSLCSPTDSAVVSDIILIETNRWRQVATTRAAGVGIRGQLYAERILKTILEENDFATANTWPAQQLFLDGRCVTFVPLVAQDEVRGWLFVETAGRLPSVIENSLTDLCIALGLAIESTGLSEQIQQEHSDKRFRALIENSNDAIFIIDATGRPLFASAEAERILHAAGESANLFQAIHPQDRAAFASFIQNAREMMLAAATKQSLEVRVVGNNDSSRWLEVTAADFTRDPDISGIIVTAHDITERKMLESDLRHRVLNDELTGIANGALLRERADHALTIRRTDNSTAALLYIDLNDFHVVNDQLGQDAGDEVLKVVAFRLDNFVRGHDTAARISADTFAVLLQDVAAETEIQSIAERLMTAVQRPIEFNGKEFVLDARIGVCVARPDYDAQVLLRNAEVALHESKAASNRISHFSETMFASAGERLELRRDLENAIINNELRVFYQPIVNLHNSNVCGFEALIRWEHPERGLVSPASFIPLAEETALIVDIGAWVIERACSQLAVWRTVRPDLDLNISINISNRQLQDPNLATIVEQAIAQTGLEPSSLILEMSETGSLGGQRTRERLAQLRQLGVQIAADDFGGGFSNYPTLEALPFTMVKIDRSLVAGLETNVQHTTIALRKIIDLAHNTNLQVAAEGIEEARQRDLLTSLGVDRAQGYFFGRPVDATAAEEFIYVAQPAG